MQYTIIIIFSVFIYSCVACQEHFLFAEEVPKDDLVLIPTISRLHEPGRLGMMKGTSVKFKNGRYRAVSGPFFYDDDPEVPAYYTLSIDRIDDDIKTTVFRKDIEIKDIDELIISLEVSKIFIYDQEDDMCRFDLNTQYYYYSMGDDKAYFMSCKQEKGKSTQQ